MITDKDYLKYKTGEATVMELAVKYTLSRQTIYNQLKRYKSEKPYRRMSKEAVASLRADLEASDGDIQTILTRYNLKDRAAALRRVGVKSLYELRNGTKLHSVLKTLRLRLNGNELYTSNYYCSPDRRLYLLPEDLEQLKSDPVQWLYANAQKVKKAISRPRKEKPARTAQLSRRYKTIEKTIELLNGGYRADDIRKVTGANYAAKLRHLKGVVNWREEAFSEAEREALGI